MRYNFKRYCKDYENIENYEKAKKDDFIGWECHHRLETHNSDGKRRLVDINRKELIALGMYYHRPPEELIFLTVEEHTSLHHKGKLISEETRRKMAELRKGKYAGEKNPMYGKHHTDEARRKMAELKKGEKNPNYGKHHTFEARQKIAEANRINRTGRHWYNNGKENKFCYECPDGFTPGRLNTK